MTLVTEARLKTACKSIVYKEYSQFAKPRISFYKNWLGFTRKYESTNFYQDWIEYSLGESDNEVYFFFLNWFFDKNSLERPTVSLGNLERAKIAIRGQHELCIGGLGFDIRKTSLPPTNYLIYSSLVKGYTKENFIPSLSY